MKELLLATIIAVMAISLGLYAQEKAQAEPVQTEEVRLELVWEKEIPSTVKDDWPYPGDLVFLDENGYNVFSSQCQNPEKALEEKRALMIHDGKIKWLEGDELKVVKEIQISEGSSPNSSKAVISKNGRNIAIIEGMERYKYEEIIENNVQNKNPGDFKNTHATIRLLNWKGEELARTQISIKEWDYIDLFPLGNDKTIALNFTGGEGRIYKAKVLVKNEHMLSDILSMEDACIWDYAENGSTVMLSILNPSTQYSKERRILNDEAEVIARYTYEPARGTYLGLVSARGNYIAEVTTGKYLVIYDRYGKLIKEHKVQGAGNYYAAFSSDEKYILVTPGFRKIYFFETKTGNLIWEYSHPEDRPSFFPACVAQDGEIAAITFTPSKEESKWIWIFNKEGKILHKIGPFDFSGYSLRASYITENQEILIKLPSKLLLYRISKSGGER